ncbi:tripartite tricarboxylate transporter substrate binding protein [Bradyrhizobium prioriisuperbiae]|uniref:Bug family tripartite tricarboxylate transporter substrate binding protein n=1 Tax=Bradyrhizobium prioriisuperbiae TaxID=2854389 RepID=UPI0028EC0023|nr:tripartite tricarboxylate transporter substrate binding protein [Bradyrhizobium prioritasuperba]
MKTTTHLAKGLTLALLAIAASPITSTHAADYPDHTVTVIVPFSAGGASDTTARLITTKMAERVKQSVIIENRAGANGAIGALAVKQAKPDGYTLLVGSIGVFAINPALFKDLRYDPQADFDLLSVAVRTPNVLVATPSFPANTVKELIAYLKANPDKVTFASSGTGSSDHLTAAMFWQKTGTTGLHVPYKGGGPAINDLIGGHANVSFQNLGAVAQAIKGGQLKALAVTSDKRNPTLPDVPTMEEAGVKDLAVYSWQATAAPKGLPPAVKATLEAELAASANSPDIKAKFEAIGFDVVATNGEQFRTFLAEEIARWKTVIEAGKISPE